ncbi:B3 domain-containing protein Os01g0723500-like [Tasmannia lanceolata]|uniref:B3 domain-containing protein Os01g0723500-like n=1 Tax=Tasmannia lanceolata TaxID=3420 RepID=UPI004062C98D
MTIPRRSSMERKPHFFKVLLGDFSHSLRIPPAFMKHISEEVSSKRTAILEGPSNKVWHVELSQKTNGTYLQDGWEEFVKAHSLKVSEFLVFRYDGNMSFNVLIFDKTACEREDIFTSDSFQEPTLFNGPEKQGKYKPSPKPEEGVIRIETEDLDLPASVAETVHYLRRRQHVMSEENGKDQGRANSFTSDFPFFTTTMTACHVHKPRTVYIPGQFARAHLPKERVKIILRDPKERTWEVQINIHRGRYTISAGWIAFARGNNLEEGDSCIFELVDKLKMCVHIFRFANGGKARIKSQAI